MSYNKDLIIKITAYLLLLTLVSTLTGITPLVIAMLYGGMLAIFGAISAITYGAIAWVTHTLIALYSPTIAMYALPAITLLTVYMIMPQTCSNICHFSWNILSSIGRGLHHFFCGDISTIDNHMAFQPSSNLFKNMTDALSSLFKATGDQYDQYHTYDPKAW